MKFFKNRMVIILLTTISMSFVRCTKDKVPNVEPPEEPSRWEKISGTYKVYDTNGVYLYEMKISHIEGVQNNGDSLRFENYYDNFTFTEWQSTLPIAETYINIREQDLIKDKNNNRWHLFQETDQNFNVVNNDTIHLRFWMSNILYYIEDVTPYFEGFVEQIAVKQH